LRYFSTIGDTFVTFFIYFSDSDTPQKQTEQILAVTPILQGQKSNEKHVIPNYQSQQQSQLQQQPKQVPADLIDFGQNGSSQPEMLNQPSDLQAAQTKNDGQNQKDMEQMLSSTNTAQGGQEQGHLLDFHDEMYNSLPQVTLKRSDTSEDEFVDAEE
jgi:oxysterol-binding protein-related protein 8